MPAETVTVMAGGRMLAHVSCRLLASAEEALREAAFGVAWNGPSLPCWPDDPAEITVSGTLWCTGYVRDVAGSHDDASRLTDITIVSRTVDAIECSIDHPTGLARDVDLAGIGRTFDTLGIGIEGSPKTTVKPVHKIRPGETLYQTLERDARSQGVLIHDTERGRLKLADRPEGRHAGRLALGFNILSARGQLSGATRFSDVKVRGQASAGVTKAVLRPEATASGGAPRGRPLILLAEGEATTDRLKKRADWEARRGAGAGVSATITVAGWRDAGGRLWTRNFLVEVSDPWLGIEQDMVIAAVSLEQDAEGGTTATLSLKDPRALGGDNPRGNSAAGWAAPANAAPGYREE